jgi:hypothetical protein
MTTKAAIIATLAVVVGAILLGLVLLAVFVDPAARDAKERAELLGQGTAMLCLVPVLVIWILWAARFRKERERSRHD